MTIKAVCVEKRCVTIPEVCVHVHMSGNREMMSENSWLPVDVGNRETLCDDKSDLHTCSHGR